MEPEILRIEARTHHEADQSAKHVTIRATPDRRSLSSRCSDQRVMRCRVPTKIGHQCAALSPCYRDVMPLVLVAVVSEARYICICFLHEF